MNGEGKMACDGNENQEKVSNNRQKLSLSSPDSLPTRLLIIWYALYQATHFVVNALALAGFARGHSAFPALPPPGGWSPQVVHFFTAMASLDAVNALLTLLFAYAYFRRRPWRGWLGTVVLTVSLYAGILFDYATLASGAWSPNLAGYLFINITFLPVVILAVLWIWWRGGGRV